MAGKSATMRLIERVERLEMTGEIGDGTVAQLHDLASMARFEQGAAWQAPETVRNAPAPIRPRAGICGATRCNDQMLCPCGLQWDCDDDEPPACPAKAA